MNEKGGPGGPPFATSMTCLAYQTPPAWQPPLLAVVQLRTEVPPFVFVIVKTLFDLACAVISCLFVSSDDVVTWPLPPPIGRPVWSPPTLPAASGMHCW